MPLTIGSNHDEVDPEKDLLVLTVQHTGTVFTLKALGFPYYELRKVRTPFKGGIIHSHFIDESLDSIRELHKELKTVITLRHPILVALSHKWRGAYVGEFARYWDKMTEIVSDGFFFPMETKPWDDLERYVGRPVTRSEKVENSVGEYSYKTYYEKGKMDHVKEWLGSDWDHCQRILEECWIAREFYASDR